MSLGGLLTTLDILRLRSLVLEFITPLLDQNKFPNFFRKGDGCVGDARGFTKIPVLGPRRSFTRKFFGEIID